MRVSFRSPCSRLPLRKTPITAKSTSRICCNTRSPTGSRSSSCIPASGSKPTAQRIGSRSSRPSRRSTGPHWTLPRAYWESLRYRSALALVSQRPAAASALIDRDARFLGEPGPGRVLARHQRAHFGGRGGARISAHAFELALDLGDGDGAAQLGVELVDDGLGQLCRAGEPGPGDDLESGDALLGDRRHVGEIAPARLARDRERAELARADARADRPRRRGDEVDVALQEAGESRRLAAIGNMQEPGLGLVGHELDRRMQDGADAGRAVFERARVLARLLDQLRERLEARVFAYADQERIEARD